MEQCFSWIMGFLTASDAKVTSKLTSKRLLACLANFAVNQL